VEGAGQARRHTTEFIDDLTETDMLELRPSCEHCNIDLPPESTAAMICTFECTFCKTCVETILHQVCPNCGGGFCQRPVRPSTVWKNALSTTKYPPGTRVVYKPVDPVLHGEFARAIKDVPPEAR
jgi:hypothetical protein